MPDTMEGAADQTVRSAAPDDRADALWIRLVDRLAKIAAVVSGVVLAIMALQIVIDVSMRNIVNQSLPGTLDYITYLWMPIVSTLGLALAQIRDEQIRVTLLVDQASASTRRWVIAIGDALTGLLVVWMAFLAYDAMILGVSGDESTILGVAVWPARIMVFVAYALFILGIAARIARDLRQRQPFVSEIDSIMKAGTDASDL